MQFHGTADPVVPYAGVPSTIANWVNYNGCPTTPEITELPDIDTTDNSTVTKSYYGPCDELSEVILYTINGGEHTWPGASFIIGVTSQDIEASFEIWDFFKRYTLDGTTATEEIEMLSDHRVNFYPNPVKDLATVELAFNPAGPFDFRMTDFTGKSVIRMDKLQNPRFMIDCSPLSPGLYFAEILANNQRFYQKVIVQ
jgi:polyhydroxybutyrate depolymerase